MEMRKKSPRKKIALLFACILCVFCLGSLLVAKSIYDSQFERTLDYDETITAYLRYMDIKDSYPRQEVRFYSGENRLQGYVYGLDNHHGLVVIAHGLGVGASHYLGAILYFVDRGWRVFAYDATGSFESEGKSIRGFPQSILDLHAALTYIEQQEAFSGLPVVLFGHSWGGYAVANLLHYEHRVHGIVAVSAPRSAEAIIWERGQDMLGNLLFLQYPFLCLYQRLLFGKAASFDAVFALNNSPYPVFVIHGIRDKTVGYHDSSILAKKEQITNPLVRFLTVTEEGRSGHRDLFRSDAAIAYVKEKNRELTTLKNEYGNLLPYEVLQQFYENFDRRIAQDVAGDLMALVHGFFLEAIHR